MHFNKIFQADDYVNKVVCESNESCWGNGICDPILNSTKVLAIKNRTDLKAFY